MCVSVHTHADVQSTSKKKKRAGANALLPSAGLTSRNLHNCASWSIFQPSKAAKSSNPNARKGSPTSSLWRWKSWVRHEMNWILGWCLPGEPHPLNWNATTHLSFYATAPTLPHQGETWGRNHLLNCTVQWRNFKEPSKAPHLHLQDTQGVRILPQGTGDDKVPMAWRCDHKNLVLNSSPDTATRKNASQPLKNDQCHQVTYQVHD